MQIVVEWLRPGDALKLGIARNLLSSGQKCSMSTRSVSSFLVCIRMVWRVQTHVQQQSFVMHHARLGLSTRSPDLLVPLVRLRSRRLSGQQPICRLCHSDGTDGLVLVLPTDWQKTSARSHIHISSILSPARLLCRGLPLLARSHSNSQDFHLFFYCFLRCNCPKLLHASTILATKLASFSLSPSVLLQEDQH